MKINLDNGTKIAFLKSHKNFKVVLNQIDDKNYVVYIGHYPKPSEQIEFSDYNLALARYEQEVKKVDSVEKYCYRGNEYESEDLVDEAICDYVGERCNNIDPSTTPEYLTEWENVEIIYVNKEQGK